jgi:hypothetical protein
MNWICFGSTQVWYLGVSYPAQLETAAIYCQIADASQAYSLASIPLKHQFEPADLLCFSRSIHAVRIASYRTCNLSSSWSLRVSMSII